jgi:hypothetical protein
MTLMLTVQLAVRLSAHANSRGFFRVNWVKWTTDLAKLYCMLFS